MTLTHDIANILRELGGPDIDETDIEWALDVPAGRKWSEWIAAQAGPGLRDVALEAKELELLEQVGEAADEPTETAGPAIPNSVLEKRARFIIQETGMLQEETVLLEARLQQGKIVSQKLKQSMSSIRAALDEQNSIITQSQERLEDLSLHADSAIASTHSDAQSLLNTVTTAIDPFSHSLQSLSFIRSSILDQHALRTGRISDAVSRLEGAQVVNDQAARVCESLGRAARGGLEDKLVAQEIMRICDALENGKIIDTLFDEMDVIRNRQLGEGNVDRRTLDVSAVVARHLENAWACDHAVLLDTKANLLDKTISVYKSAVLDPLAQLCDRLRQVDDRARSSEALLGALVVEFEDIVDDVTFAKAHQQGQSNNQTDKKENTLYEKLVFLLKNLKDLRDPIAPPLVLLQESDILEELSALTQGTEEKEVQWIQNAISNLSSLQSSNAPLISRIYKHSPLITSSPLTLAPRVTELEDRATSEADDLSKAVAELQKETNAVFESARTKRRLNAFIDKWSK